MSEYPVGILRDGLSIPMLGFGTSQLDDGMAERAVSQALDVGYRHIDTAEMYGNEAGIGRALKSSALPRDQIYITTKLWNDHHHRQEARQALESSLEKLGLDYLDLYLIHWPAQLIHGDSYLETWEAFQDFQAEGLVRSIGVSNFSAEQIDRLPGAVPSVNQIELHPSFAQAALRADMAARRIAVTAWSPLGQGQDLQATQVIQVAQDLGVSPAQVILRWQLQNSVIVIPKSANRQRIKRNFDVLDFWLSETQMGAINMVDSGNRIGPDPAIADF